MSEAAPIIGPDGVEMKSVKVMDSLPFARACLAVMHERDGKPRTDWLKRRSFWVPADVLPMARQRVEAKRAG